MRVIKEQRMSDYNPSATVSFALASLGLAVFFGLQLHGEFFPPSDEGLFVAKLEAAPGVPTGVARLAFRLVPGADTDRVLAPRPLLRVAARHEGPRYDGRTVEEARGGTVGRIAVARLVGTDDESSGNPETAHRAKLAIIALFQISRTICTRGRQDHDQCPLRESCWTVRKEAEAGGPEAVRLPIEALPPQRLHLD